MLNNKEYDKVNAYTEAFGNTDIENEPAFRLKEFKKQFGLTLSELDNADIFILLDLIACEAEDRKIIIKDTNDLINNNLYGYLEMQDCLLDESESIKAEITASNKEQIAKHKARNIIGKTFGLKQD